MGKHVFALLAVLLTFASCNPDNTETGQSQGNIPIAQWTWDGTKSADITYQLLVYSFADSDGDLWGDFKGLENHLDYIDALGATAVWLSPIHPCNSYHGYDSKDYDGVNPRFGSEDDFKSFIAAAHKKGIKVYLDFVLNHTSVEHPWFKSAAASESSPYRDWYIFSSDPQKDIASGRIPMIATEGSSGYDNGQWFTTNTGAGTTGRLHFTLDWSDSAAPTVTVSRWDGDIDADNTDKSSGGKYLYFGNGVCKRFYDKGEGIYELSVDFNSDWGFLIRTSTTSWEAGFKYGASSNSDVIAYDVPFALKVRTSSFDPSNIQFNPSEFFHSHFWTGYFADLNYGSVAECESSGPFNAMVASASKWINMGVDGLRLDAVKHIYHNGYNYENPEFLSKFYNACNKAFKAAGGKGDFYMVGEMYDEADKVAPYYKGLPALFEFSFWYRLQWAINNGVGCYFTKDISGYEKLYETVRPDYIEATKLSNHDEDRAAEVLGRDVAKEKLAGCVLLTAAGSPYIYQGEELGYWGSKSGGDEFVRTPIMWKRDGSTNASAALGGKITSGMLSETISVESQESDAESILNVYRRFARARNAFPALAKGALVAHGTYNQSYTANQALSVWYRVAEGQKALVIHNFSDKEASALFPDDDLSMPVVMNGNIRKENDALIIGPYSSIVFIIE